MLHQLANRDGQAADLDIGCRVPPHLDEMAQRAGVGRDEDLGLGCVWQHASSGLSRLLAPQRPVVQVLEFLGQTVSQRPIRNLAGPYRVEPEPVQFRVAAQ